MAIAKRCPGGSGRGRGVGTRAQNLDLEQRVALVFLEGGAVPSETTVAPTMTTNETGTVPAATTGAATAATTNGNGTATATPTQSPGFGALVALVGLGAVAVLVLRRN